MLFRMMVPEDIPDMCKLYQQYIDHKTAPYPKVSDQPTVDFAQTALQQLLCNQNWFCVVGVVGAETVGETVRGGRVKGFGAAFVAERPLSRPSPYGFCELVVVDENMREKGVGEKILAILNRIALERGALVIECSYQPGTTSARIWEAAGFIPYTVMAAYIDPNTGESRAGIVQLPHRVSQPAPAAPLPPRARKARVRSGAKTVPSVPADGEQES